MRSLTMLRSRRKKTERIVKLTSCPIIVAIAAPAIPRCSTKIKIGSRIRFKIPPADMPIIEYSACPSARRMLLSTNAMHINGAAIRMYFA